MPFQRGKSAPVECRKSPIRRADTWTPGTAAPALGFDLITGTISKEYSDERLEALLNGLSSEFLEVQVRHLTLLESFIRQVRMPDSVLHGRVIPALTLYVNEKVYSVSVASQEDSRLRVALWAQWQELSALPTPKILSPADLSWMTWLVGNLEDLGGPEAVKVLEKIWQDPDYEFHFRYRAQEALIRLGYVEPDDRTVLYDL